MVRGGLKSENQALEKMRESIASSQKDLMRLNIKSRAFNFPHLGTCFLPANLHLSLPTTY